MSERGILVPSLHGGARTRNRSAAGRARRSTKLSPALSRYSSAALESWGRALGWRRPSDSVMNRKSRLNLLLFAILALAALVILVADPPSLFSISFQLSFSAVFAIIYGFSRVQNRTALPKIQTRNNWRLRFKSWLIGFFLVSLFAICGSLPLVAFYFNQISLVGLAANFIVVPLVGFLTIPLGLVALFVSPLSTTAALWCIQTGSGILTIALEVVRFFADLPFAAIKTFTPSLLEIGCFYLLCWALLNLGRQPRFAAVNSRDGTGAASNSVTSNFEISLWGLKSGLRKFLDIFRELQFNRFSQSHLAIAVLVLVFVTLAADTGYWLYQRFGSADLRVTVIDVGHGSAALLELPGGYTMLIDGGGFADNSAFDAGAAIVAPLLRRKKIRTVDTLILSHPNSDHLNGLIYIVERLADEWDRSLIHVFRIED